ncbi:hypothetical protein [Actinoallomurus iriomotensis]|uniref:Uncharacterized protein n=1 Tax=Actinoallomurus iriomotensis TaxID=478107 RepID=A0A9W6RRI8_9ACTN|nr:hypothetical protein [Actinoallomurus iriomotensis]GLY78640.1 hypothetical protein Airi01_069070 [Actinoallomurus iriomotensis]
MGFFGAYLFDGSQWSSHEPGSALPGAGLWLLVDIHDSDFTTVSYGPPGSGSGVAFLGYTPRAYFEDAKASEPTDVAREAAGLTDWWELRNEAGDIQRSAKEAELRLYLAGDDDWPEDEDEDEEDDTEDVDDAEVFVEIKTARFLKGLDLPLPDDLQDMGAL